jgi:AcrR family transcriptional regulator
MPTSTFFNLPQEKREKLICAIKNEFSRAPFDEVSINKIVHAAEIPRGSFYQYFTDKNDMLGFILAEYQKQMLSRSKECLRANNGDIFSMFYCVLEFTIGFALEKSSNNFCKNLFADIKVNTEFYLKMPKSAAEMDAMIELKPDINLELLDIREKEDFLNMLGMLISVCRDAIVEVFLNLEDRENIKQQYKKKLELLKRGFMKNKE